VRILYLDGSKEFGGATRSLFLVLSRLPGVETTLVTSHAAVARELVPHARIHPLRQIFDYRMRMRLDSVLERRGAAGLFARLARTAYAFAARAEGALITLWVVLIARQCGADALHLNTGFDTIGGLTAGRILQIPRIVHLRGFQTSRRRWR
jgi:hypothetical protein